MHVFQTLENLVYDVLLMYIFKYIGSDDSMKISVHEVEHQVNVSIIFSSDNILKADNIFMTRQFLQENDFSKRSLCISCILKGIKILLESHNVLCFFVDSFPHDTVGSLSYK